MFGVSERMPSSCSIPSRLTLPMVQLLGASFPCQPSSLLHSSSSHVPLPPVVHPLLLMYMPLRPLCLHLCIVVWFCASCLRLLPDSSHSRNRPFAIFACISTSSSGPMFHASYLRQYLGLCPCFPPVPMALHVLLLAPHVVCYRVNSEPQ
jgi:hypothetical protein